MRKPKRVKIFSLHIKFTKLKIKHGLVSAKIASELKRPVPCSIVLQSLKKQRVHLKDQMRRCLVKLKKIGAIKPTTSKAFTSIGA